LLDDHLISLQPTYLTFYTVLLIAHSLLLEYCGYPLWCVTNSNGYSLYREKRGTSSNVNCLVGEKSIRCDVIDDQINELISPVVLDEAWKDKIIARISTQNDHDQILKERKSITERLRRLSRTYIDGLLEDGEYELKQKLLQDRLSTLVIPEIDAAVEAGELLENIGTIWSIATMEEKHKLLALMLDAVYIDLFTTRKVVGVLPKPVFYPLFEILKNTPESPITIFRANEDVDYHNAMVGLVGDGGGLNSA
jgi:site-specific DNA recombinase